MTIAKITNHLGEALDRLLEQYKSKANLQAVLEIYLDQVQQLEDALYPLFDALKISVMEGAMLDLIGQIVGQPRTTNLDSRYRILLYVKIHQNVSEGEPERVISVFKLLTESQYIHYINLSTAEVQVQITNQTLTQDEINLIYRETQKVVAAGVRIAYIIAADPVEAFAYAGSNAGAQADGYDDGSGTVGGKYATGLINKVPFAYAGSDESGAGYGAGCSDPLAGGVYVA
jgi:hypothetical protein